MSIRVAIGSKIYDISNFSEEEHADVLELSKSLNYRVNQVISAFGIYDQEMALIMAALSLLEELKTLESTQTSKATSEPDLFTYQTKKEKVMFSKNEVDMAVKEAVDSLHAKLKDVVKKVG
jgi:cell division protein ZapA (FtsZ GTPase activity inhibitor)